MAITCNGLIGNSFCDNVVQENIALKSLPRSNTICSLLHELGTQTPIPNMTSALLKFVH